MVIRTCRVIQGEPDLVDLTSPSFCTTASERVYITLKVPPF
jgi:hypothetical protein